MTVVQDDFVEELLVGGLQQLFERRQIGRTVAAALAAIKEGVDSLAIGNCGESAPSARRIKQLGDDDRPVDGLQRCVTHAMGAQDPQCI